MASLAHAMGTMATGGAAECCVRNEAALGDPAAVATLLSPFMCKANSESLQVISIEECGLTQGGVNEVSRALRAEFPNLTEVTLTHCAELDADGSAALVDACAESHSEKLRSLTLASVADVPGGLSRLPASLADLACLRELGLGFGNLGTDGAAALLDMLVRAAIPIETLGLRGNHIEELPAEKIQALSTLQVLWLARNQLDTDAAADLMRALQSTNVQFLSLGKNRISAPSFDAFPPTLTHLWLDENPIENPCSYSTPVHPFKLLNVTGTGLMWNVDDGADLARVNSTSVEFGLRMQFRAGVPFKGQTLLPATYEMMVAKDKNYMHGWVCDGCAENFPAPVRSRWAIQCMYHGQDELGAWDLCDTCATDPAAAEKRFDEREKRLEAEAQAAKSGDLEGELMRERRARMKAEALLDRGRQVRPKKPKFAGARMLFPHSGRHGFEPIPADPNVPSPSKSVVCAMLRREAEWRGHPTTQRVLDNIEVNNQDHFQPCTIGDEWCEAVLRRIGRMKSSELKVQLRQLGLNAKGSTATLRSRLFNEASRLSSCITDTAPSEDSSHQQPAYDNAPQPRDMQEALTLINALRSGLQRLEAQSDFTNKALDDAQVFRSIKERVIEEFGMPKEYIDILYSAQSRFPGDPDVINSAGYLKYNRSKQGTLNEGDAVPMHEMPLASLDGNVFTLAERLADDPQGPAERPVVIVAGSIT